MNNVTIKVCHQPAKLSSHRHCGIGDIMFLGCHVMSQDQVFKGSCNLPSW